MSEEEDDVPQSITDLLADPRVSTEAREGILGAMQVLARACASTNVVLSEPLPPCLSGLSLEQVGAITELCKKVAVAAIRENTRQFVIEIAKETAAAGNTH